MKILAIGDFHGKFPKRFEQIIKKEKIDTVVDIGDHATIEEWYPYFMTLFRKLKKKGERISAEEYFGKKKLKKLEKKDFEAGKKVFRKLNEIGKKIPTLFIFGNGDDDWYRYPFDKRMGKRTSVDKKRLKFMERQKNLIDINYRTRIANGYKFLGFGGFMDTDLMLKRQSYDTDKGIAEKRKRRAKSKKKLNRILKNIKKKDKAIFVFHYTPKGVFDIIKDKKNVFNGENTGISIFTDAIQKKKPLLALCGHMHEYQGMKKLHGVPVINPGDAGHGKCAVIEIEDRKLKKVRFVK
jgi:Icc-related predicted phosphoesterase